MWNNITVSEAIKVNITHTFNANAITIDTRDKNIRNSLFIGLTETRNGGDFADTAIDMGAALCIVDHDAKCSNHDQIVRVSSPYEALITLAKYNRNRFQGKTICVTGSSGKTTIKEMLRLIFSKVSRKVYTSYKNFNNHIGLPLSICNTPIESHYAIFEIGINHTGEMASLTSIAQPDIAIICNVQLSHIGNFSSFKELLAEKCKIIDATKHCVIYHDQTPGIKEFIESKYAHKNIRLLTFGENKTSTIHINSREQNKSSQKIQATLDNLSFSYNINTPGKHIALNTLPAITALYASNHTIDEITLSSLQEFKCLNGRGEVINMKKYIIVDESYNANRDSVKAAIDRLIEMQQNNPNILRSIAVLGDMYELGTLSDELHKEVIQYISSLPIDIVHIVGNSYNEHFYKILPQHQQGSQYESIEQIVDDFKKNHDNIIKQGDAVMIKGSNGVSLYKLVDVLRK